MKIKEMKLNTEIVIWKIENQVIDSRLKLSWTPVKFAVPPFGGETLRILQASSRVRPEAERVLAAVGLPWEAAAYF